MRNWFVLIRPSFLAVWVEIKTCLFAPSVLLLHFKTKMICSILRNNWHSMWSFSHVVISSYFHCWWRNTAGQTHLRIITQTRSLETMSFYWNVSPLHLQIPPVCVCLYQNELLLILIPLKHMFIWPSAVMNKWPKVKAVEYLKCREEKQTEKYMSFFWQFSFSHKFERSKGSIKVEQKHFL